LAKVRASAAGSTGATATSPGVAKRAKKVTAQTGRPLGPRALKTRERLMDATGDLLAEKSILDISVVDIARKVGTSPATFYHYFKDVEEVTLHLAERAADEMPAVVEMIDGSWTGEEGLTRARRIVDAFIAHWDSHHAVLQLRNLGADRGDKRFIRIRRDALGPVLDSLAAHIGQTQKRGSLPASVHPYIAAAALGSILERLSAYHRELGYFGATREDVVQTCAYLLYQTVNGRSG
jgi:AcrR family transcriptional regulator